jgi:hypothetical protein
MKHFFLSINQAFWFLQYFFVLFSHIF